jgi:hypothetical protein
MNSKRRSSVVAVDNFVMRNVRIVFLAVKHINCESKKLKEVTRGIIWSVRLIGRIYIGTKAGWLPAKKLHNPCPNYKGKGVIRHIYRVLI